MPPLLALLMLVFIGFVFLASSARHCANVLSGSRAAAAVTADPLAARFRKSLLVLILVTRSGLESN
jgi:hypothetical protein